jgi:hypothetical protein
MPLLAVEIASDRMVGAIAEESALEDRDLDSIEVRLGHETDRGMLAALSLTLGRAGRASSARALGAVRARLGDSVEARAVSLAIELLSIEPPPHLERAELGYRRIDPFTQEELFIEDPLAAHWHHERRWGPPIRLDHTCPAFLAHESSSDAYARIRAGEIAVVTFEANRLFAPIHPALRLARCGFTTDASLRNVVRWSRVRSVGVAESRFARRAAYEIAGEAVATLPGRPVIGTEALVELMTRLLKSARS